MAQRALERPQRMGTSTADGSCAVAPFTKRYPHNRWA